MNCILIVIKNTDSTVVSEYTPEYKTTKHYQSEAELEKDFIERPKKTRLIVNPLSSV